LLNGVIIIINKN